MRLGHLLEYAAARSALALVDILPLPAVLALARSLGTLWYRLDGARRRVAIGNLHRSAIPKTKREARRLAADSFRHFACVIAESLRSADLPAQSVTWHVPEELDRLLRTEGQGIILATGHLGNWEIAAQQLSAIKPVLGVTRKMNNPYIERLVSKRKPRNRFELTPKHDADIGRFMAALKEGRILALMIDQHAGSRGTPIEFFGQPASTHTAIALLHLITGMPLCFGWCIRSGPGRFELHATGPFRHTPTGDKQRDVQEILNLLNRELETAIRAHPDQYLWAHRRWREGRTG